MDDRKQGDMTMAQYSAKLVQSDLKLRIYAMPKDTFFRPVDVTGLPNPRIGQLIHQMVGEVHDGYVLIDSTDGWPRYQWVNAQYWERVMNED
jgi:hypothetical protein